LQRRLLLTNYAAALVEIGHRELDVQLAAWLAGGIVAGSYRLAKTLAMFVLESLNPIVLVLLPEMSRRLAAPVKASMSHFLRRIMLAFAAVGWAAGILVIVLAYAYLRWFATKQEGAMAPVAVLVAGFVLVAPALWAQAYLVAAGRAFVYLKLSVLGVALSVACAMVMVAPLGAIGSAIAHIVGLAVTSIGSAVFAWRFLREEGRLGSTVTP